MAICNAVFPCYTVSFGGFTVGLVIVMCLLVTGIAIIVSYSVGHNAGLGKPVPQEALPPGTTYAPLRFFGNSSGARCLVLEDKNGAPWLCDIGDGPIPEGKTLIASVQGDGKVRLVPLQPHLDTIA